jgi:hypothetical protein
MKQYQSANWLIRGLELKKKVGILEALQIQAFNSNFA